jgi:hypothetical protein
MPHNKFAKDALFLLHSDQKLQEILNASNEYLEQHSNVREKINDCTWVLRSLCDLMPETVENFWSATFCIGILRSKIPICGRNRSSTGRK